ncbi:hypothetical protein L0666_01650 [Octadecabacter sp. CECT 8868]|uniref:hypothetical protein n=1 Tax=Octadecabacter algicola TaxID=2909342 RepID=UPI001F179BC1|nr:hypothetical protein [Octadecabacter algicola]MCF2903679.1 hypothetical protein [Octadecabacter algicola]
MIPKLLLIAALVVPGTFFFRHISGLDLVLVWAAIGATAPLQWIIGLILPRGIFAP